MSHVEPEVENISLNGNYTDYSLGFQPAANYEFNVSLKDNDKFYYPEKNTKVASDDVSTEGMRHIDGKVTSTKESYSTAKSAGTNVRIKTKNGSVHLGYNK